MARSLILGNGNVLVGLDRFGQVRDFYFHYVGLENHLSHNMVHRIGVWVDGRFAWLGDASWQIEVSCEDDTLAGVIVAVNKDLQVKLEFNDVVYNEKNLFIRHIAVTNQADRERRVKVFLL